MWSKIKETIGNSKHLQTLQRSRDADYVDRDPVYLKTPDGKSVVKLERRPRLLEDQARDIKSLLDRIFADGEITLQEYIALTRRVGESNQNKNSNDTLIKKLYVLIDAFDGIRRKKALTEVKAVLEEENRNSPLLSVKKKMRRKSTLPSKHALWIIRTTKDNRGPSTSTSMNLGSSWRALIDGEKLEAAYQKDFHGLVYIEDGRYTVDMKRRVVTPTFWNGQPLEIRRATWFFTLRDRDEAEEEEEEKTRQRLCTRTSQLFNSTAPLYPYSEDEAAKLEQFVRYHGTQYENSMELSLPILDYVRGVRVEASLGERKRNKKDDDDGEGRNRSSIGSIVHNLLTTTPEKEERKKCDFNATALNPEDLEASSWIRTVWNPLASYPRTLCRGLPKNSKGPPSPCRRCVHLVLVVHGIGEEYCRKVQMSTNCDSAEKMRRECEKRFAELDSERAQFEYVEVLPIDWSDALHGTPHLLQTLNQVTMKNLVRIRNLARYLMSDVMHFMEPRVRQIIFDTVVRRMNRVVHKFRQIHGHDVPVSIFAHSLGSIISFDILSHQDQESKDKDGEEKREEREHSNNSEGDVVIVPQLSFRPANFFACGSPIGFFVSIRKQAIGKDWRLPTCKNMFNIFHPRDPFAHRVEPLIDLNLGDLPPARIKSVSGTSPYHIVASDAMSIFFNTATRVAATRSARRRDSPTSMKRRFGIINNGNRVDYAIQESTAEAAMEYVAALTSHSTYWDHPDVVNLWVSQVLLLGGDGGDFSSPML